MLGLYIHIPFCKQKCYYCDFFSVEYDVVLVNKYVDALIKHASQFRNQKINSIYIGGGTPSVLSLKQLEKLLQTLNNIFDLSEVCEFTFELNPESTSKEKLRLLKNFGINRLSIGLQSVEDNSLKFLGRIHDFQTFCNIYDIARKESFNNINIDLIYGLSNQTVKEWERDLKRALLFNSEHLSLYPLSIEEGTPFYLNSVTINDNIQRDMYDKAVEVLASNGYAHYEISNWTKRGRESFHNSNYWRNFEYIGLGAGAAGYLRKIRYKNIDDIEKYIAVCSLLKDAQSRCGNISSLEMESEYIGDELYKTEKIILGLRLLNEGIDVNCFNSSEHQIVLLECLKDKTLEQDNDAIKLSKEFIFVFNQIVSKFM
ncbi:MAG: radical SAM family heme chaperone HemW [Endomicrobium sp.]|uniref:radical SAM family heme chaperone HemW n=1 Tax=Candidatus Endomicrobiellum pyrsonymphae TaxID=1408203 RepID=UPI00357628ED|nr:radical SAM family heme chaperone HemW [Endomicrobium sp.]